MTSALVQRTEEAVPAALFAELCRRVKALGTERLRTTYQTTFWYPFTGPRSVPEQVIEALRPRVSSTKIVGVEWWLSRMRTSDVRVDFHQDRDEKLALETGKLRHPKTSSVLFLNRVKGGLLAVTRELPNPANPSLAPDVLDLDLVAPQPNRLVTFDGALTHGVLDANNAVPTGVLARPGALRLTLIMNWWDRRPTRVPTFSESRAYRSLGLQTGRRPARGELGDP